MSVAVHVPLNVTFFCLPKSVASQKYSSLSVMLAKLLFERLASGD